MAEAFPRVLLQERPDAFQPFILRRVCQLVHEQRAIAPMIRVDKDAVADGEAGCLLRLGTRHARESSSPSRKGNALDTQHADAFRKLDTDGMRIRELLLIQRNSGSKNLPLPMRYPEDRWWHRERSGNRLEQLVQNNICSLRQRA